MAIYENLKTALDVLLNTLPEREKEILKLRHGMVDGNEVAMSVKKGDQVIYSRYAGTDVKLDGEEYVIVRQNDILAVVK